MSVPTDEKLSRNLFCRPLAAVIVSTTATMPMMMPSVVSAPRPLLARTAPMPIWSDSRSWTVELMASFRASTGPHPFPHRGLLLADRHRGSVLEILRDRAIAAGDDLIALLQPVEDLDQLLALDAGLDL